MLLEVGEALRLLMSLLMHGKVARVNVLSIALLLLEVSDRLEGLYLLLHEVGPS